MSAFAPAEKSIWTQAWPDALAFLGGLAIAWFAGWGATDLVWSLWLSSLVVGYALIVWGISAPLRETLRARVDGRPPSPVTSAGAAATLGCGSLFLLAFFTVHFGGFHFVHSVFLSVFFPIDGARETGAAAPPSLAIYREIVARYWIFLPAAFIAERAAFRTKPEPQPETSIRRKTGAGNLMAPYKNVIRMHLLIFFFAFAHFAHLESFAIYTVVYAVYFFPWRLMKRRRV